MSTKEVNLPVSSAIGLNDLIRIINQAQSRSILYSDFLADFQARTFEAKRQTNFLTTLVDYTIKADDQTILTDAGAGELTVTLPLIAEVVSPIPTPTISAIFTIKKIGTSQVNDVVILPNSALIDGAAELRLQGANYPFVSLMSDGIGWYTI